VLALANIGFHVEAHVSGIAEFSIRTAVAAIVIFITLIGGRTVPSFTNNWLSRKNPGRLALPSDASTSCRSLSAPTALFLWGAVPEGHWTGLALLWQAGRNVYALPDGREIAQRASAWSSFFTSRTPSFLWVLRLRGWPPSVSSFLVLDYMRGWPGRPEP
jgi:uncharacterized protein involved in response to NO